MLEFRKKNQIRKVLYSPIIVLILAILFVILFRGAWGVYKKDKLSHYNLDQEKKELDKIMKRQESLETALAYLSTDRGVESEIRSKFRAVKQGEKISVIIDDEKPEATSSTTTKKSFWYKIFNW
jgi:cell division protein FtsB